MTHAIYLGFWLFTIVGYPHFILSSDLLKQILIMTSLLHVLFFLIAFFVALQDQFDTIDFTDNDIRKLDKFPLLKRLKHVLLSNNRIV